MKVCHITSVHSRYDIRIFHKESTSAAKNFETYLVVADGQGDELKNNVSIQDAGKRPNNRILRILLSPWKVYKTALKTNSDIFHFHDPELLPIGLLLRLKKKIAIYDSHEDLPQDILTKKWIPSFLRKPISWIVKLIELFCAKRFSAIIGATDFITQSFKKANSQSITLNNFPILSSLPTAQPKEKAGPVIYIGGISEFRGIKQLIEVASSINGELIIAGKFLDNAQQACLEHPDWKNINFLGLICKDEVEKLLARASIGLVTFLPGPNHTESQPNKMFEYMSASIPVIASNFPLWKKIVEKNQCGICVDPLNPEEITQAINYILAHPSEAQAMGEKGRIAVQKEYNWQQEEKKLITLYTQLAKSKKPPHTA